MFGRAFIMIAWIGLIFGVLWTVSIHRSPTEEDHVLNVYAWPEMFLPEVLANFERDTGIKVKRHYFSTNEELLITLRATEGKGYDVIIPSDYAVQMLIEDDLLKPLDKSKLNFLEHLNPILLNQKYDPKNSYALPYQWEAFGFGIDNDYFEKYELSPNWDLIFHPSRDDLNIAMVNDPIEALNFAAYHLFGPYPQLDKIKTKQVEKLLTFQKNWVEAYSGIRADYLLATKNSHLALSTSSVIFRCSKQYPHVKFILPKDWSFISIENVCIPKNSQKDELIYAFLNYIYKPKNLAKDTNKFFSFPATTNATPYIEAPEEFLDILENTSRYQDQFYYMHHLIPEKAIRAIWVDIKS